MENERLTIHYSGRVQGVGFRWTTVRALAGLPVTGYVRNLDDGRVEMVLEGRPEHNLEALSRVREALGRRIRDEKRSSSPPTGEFDGFGIRR